MSTARLYARRTYGQDLPDNPPLAVVELPQGTVNMLPPSLLSFQGKLWLADGDGFVFGGAADYRYYEVVPVAVAPAGA